MIFSFSAIDTINSFELLEPVFHSREKPNGREKTAQTAFDGCKCRFHLLEAGGARAGEVHQAHHRGAGEDVQHLLDAVDVGGEGGDDDPLLAALELPHEGLAHAISSSPM